MPHKANDNSTNCKVIPASNVFTGTMANDGGYNVRQVSGAAFTGAYDASGALNVVITTSNQTSAYHPCGARWASVSPYKLGTLQLTPTAGSFT